MGMIPCCVWPRKTFNRSANANGYLSGKSAKHGLGRMSRACGPSRCPVASHIALQSRHVTLSWHGMCAGFVAELLMFLPFVGISPLRIVGT